MHGSHCVGTVLRTASGLVEPREGRVLRGWRVGKLNKTPVANMMIEMNRKLRMVISANSSAAKL